MQYAFENWNLSKPQPPEEEFSFSEELAELEASLTIRDLPPTPPEFSVSLNQEAPQGIPVQPAATLPVEQVVSAVSEQVVQKMHEWQAKERLDLEADLAEWKRQAQEFYEDNRVLAAQIQQLLQEKDQLQQVAAGQERELKRFIQVLPGLYIRV